MFEKKFLVATGERALKTFFQTLVALLGTDATGLVSVDIVAIFQIALWASVLSVLSSFASAGVGKTGPSLVGESTETLILVQQEAPKKTTSTKKKAVVKKAQTK
jgi:hypothetical protein